MQIIVGFIVRRQIIGIVIEMKIFKNQVDVVCRQCQDILMDPVVCVLLGILTGLIIRTKCQKCPLVCINLTSASCLRS